MLIAVSICGSSSRQRVNDARGLPVLIGFTWLVAAADGAGQVPARVGRVYHQLRHRVPGDTSPEPEPVVDDLRGHPLASLLADVWRSVPRRRQDWNGFVDLSYTRPLCRLISLRWLLKYRIDF